MTAGGATRVGRAAGRSCDTRRARPSATTSPSPSTTAATRAACAASRCAARSSAVAARGRPTPTTARQPAQAGRAALRRHGGRSPAAPARARRRGHQDGGARAVLGGEQPPRPRRTGRRRGRRRWQPPAPSQRGSSHDASTTRHAYARAGGSRSARQAAAAAAPSPSSTARTAAASRARSSRSALQARKSSSPSRCAQVTAASSPSSEPPRRRVEQPEIAEQRALEADGHADPRHRARSAAARDAHGALGRADALAEDPLRHVVGGRAAQDRRAARRVDLLVMRAVGERGEPRVVEADGCAQLGGEGVDERLDVPRHAPAGSPAALTARGPPADVHARPASRQSRRPRCSSSRASPERRSDTGDLLDPVQPVVEAAAMDPEPRRGGLRVAARVQVRLEGRDQRRRVRVAEQALERVGQGERRRAGATRRSIVR